MCVWSLGREDLLEEGTATHCSILAWRIPWTEEPGGLQSIESQRVGHNCSNLAHTAYLSISLLVISSFLCAYFCPFSYSCVSFSSWFWWWCVCLCVGRTRKGKEWKQRRCRLWHVWSKYFLHCVCVCFNILFMVYMLYALESLILM